MDWSLIGLGCLGGAIPDVIRLIKGRYKMEMPKYLSSAVFWVGFLLLIGLGGLAAWIGNATGSKEALAFGFGAPEFISKVLATGSQEKGERDTDQAGIRDWWAL